MTSAADVPAEQSAAAETPARAFLVAGADGMLGTALQLAIARSGAAVCAPARADFDVTDEAAVLAQVATFAETLAPGQRGVLVNAAAYTDVERAEDEPERAFAANERGPAVLARAAREAGLAFAHVSTDFVFDGGKAGAYSEADEPNPLSVYGASKLAGELAVFAEDPDALVVRTAWLFGSGPASFPEKILQAARTRPSLSVVTDEVGPPTYVADFAAGLLGLVDAGATGLFHLTGVGSCSRYEFALEILRLAGLDAPVEPVTSDRFPTKAQRPKNSVLDCSKAAALGVTLPEWRDALARYLAERLERV